jgi:hypothetical protein
VGNDIVLCDIHFIILCESPEPHGVRGMFVRETLALQAGTVCSENRSKARHTPIVELCNGM